MTYIFRNLERMAGLALLVVLLGPRPCHGQAALEAKALRLRDVKVCFSPDRGCEDLVVSRIKAAKKTLVVAIYSLTHDGIASAILEAKARGVEVRVLADDLQAKGKGSRIPALAATVPVGLDKWPGQGHFHHKFLVTDGECLTTGSFNWTGRASELNNENLLSFCNRSLAAVYIAEFEALWRKSWRSD